jgi:hypothetical protein
VSSDGSAWQSSLSDSAARAAHVEPIRDVGVALAELLEQQPTARVCVLPEGPQTIPYV